MPGASHASAHVWYGGAIVFREDKSRSDLCKEARCAPPGLISLFSSFYLELLASALLLVSVSVQFQCHSLWYPDPFLISQAR